MKRRTFLKLATIGLAGSAWPRGGAAADKGEASARKTETSGERLDNNLKCVDLSDLTAELPLDVDFSKQILWQSEEWEHSTWGDPEARQDTVGYPTVVRNDRGPGADNLFYLYYAHHDPNSGIGCAVSESMEGPYRKLAELDSTRKDSRVLVNPGKPGQPLHYSSPCVVWCREERLWFMYFHYLDYLLPGESGDQWTALATCGNLAKNVWTPWVNDKGRLINVFPITKARWMNSQSSYHAIQRLPDGRWLGFLRGTGGEHDAEGKWLQDPPMLGIATSRDGRRWDYFAENPVIHQTDGGGGRKGVYRPHFIGYLGHGEYMACWSESLPYDSAPKIMYGKTKDFKTFKRDQRGYARWPFADGLISPWREGDQLYLFGDKHVRRMSLPVG